MFDQKDYYGNQYKWFIGKVKDVNDPLNSNRDVQKVRGG